MEKLIDLKYQIIWRIEQVIHKIINKPVKGYKRTLTIKEILKGWNKMDYGRKYIDLLREVKNQKEIQKIKLENEINKLKTEIEKEMAKYFLKKEV